MSEEAFQKQAQMIVQQAIGSTPETVRVDLLQITRSRRKGALTALRSLDRPVLSTGAACG